MINQDHRISDRARFNIVALVLVLIGLSAAGYFVIASRAATTSLKPSASAYTNQANPTKNYSNPGNLYTNGGTKEEGDTQRSYLKFSVNASSAIRKATLRLYTKTSNDHGYTIKQVTDNSWRPGSVTYRNPPPVGGEIGQAGGFSANTWTSVDVSSVVKINGTYSFAIWPRDTKQITYSNTGDTTPQLIIETGTGGPPSDTTPPTGKFVLPAQSGATASGVNYVLSVAATDNNPTGAPLGGIAKVDYFDNGQLIKSQPATAYGAAIVWDTTKAANGTHNLSANIYDIAGNKGTTTTTVNVQNGGGCTTNCPTPTVSIGAPTNGAVINIGDSTNLIAVVSSATTVNNVQFFSNNTKLGDGTPTAFGTYQLQWNTVGQPAGQVALTAKAIVNSSTTITSSPVTITLKDNTPCLAKPNPPTNLTATASTGKVALSWTASVPPANPVNGCGAAAKYIIFRTAGSTTTFSVNAPTVTFDDTTAAASTSYTYTVIAQDSLGNRSNPSKSQTVTTPSVTDTTPPNPPANLTGTAVSQTQINLSWSPSTDPPPNSSGIKGYQIFRDGNKISGNNLVTGTTFGDTGLTADTTYNYTTKAVDGAGNVSADSNTVTVKTQGPPPPPPPSGGPCGLTSAPPAKYNHVIVVVMENHHWADVLNGGGQYMTQLKNNCATATNYAQAGSPSRPNYVAMVSGSVQGCNGSNADAPDCQSSADNIMRQARVAGGTSKVYSESMTSNCQYNSSGPYATKHNSYPYFIGADDKAACARDNVPFGSPTAGNFINDLNADRLPTWSMIDPNLCNDTHDCATSTGDNWLKTLLPQIFNSLAYQRHDTAVIVTYDEYTPLPNIFIAPSVKSGSVYSGGMSHYGQLRTMEEMLGFPLLGQASSAPSMRSPFNM